MRNNYFKSLCCIPTSWVDMPYRKVVGFFFLGFFCCLVGWGVFSLIISVTVELLGLSLKPVALTAIFFPFFVNKICSGRFFFCCFTPFYCAKGQICMVLLAYSKLFEALLKYLILKRENKAKNVWFYKS